MYDVFLIFFIWLEDLLAQVCMVCFLMYHVIFFINNISLLLLKNILFSFYFKGNFILFTLKKGEKKLRHHKIITDLRWYWIYTMVHQKKKKKKNLNDVLQGNPTLYYLSLSWWTMLGSQVTINYTLLNSNFCLSGSAVAIPRRSHVKLSMNPTGGTQLFSLIFSDQGEPHSCFSVSLVFYSFCLFSNLLIKKNIIFSNFCVKCVTS